MNTRSGFVFLFLGAAGIVVAGACNSTNEETPSGTPGDDGGGAGGGGASSAAPTCVPPEGGTTTPAGTYSQVATGDVVPANLRVSNGNPVLPPKWAFGVLYGSYYDQIGSIYAKGGNLIEAAQWLRCAGYGGDLLWIDSSWLYRLYTTPAAGPHYICFQFDPVTFPDATAMIKQIRQMNFHFGVWQWPWMGRGCDNPDIPNCNYDYGVQNQLFVMKNSTTEAPANAPTTGGNTGAPWHGDTSPAQFDFTNPATVAWWKSLNQGLSSAGLDMLKLDATQAQQALPVQPANGGSFKNGDVNAYSQAYHKAGFELTAQYSEMTNPEAMNNGGRGFILVHGDPGAGEPFGTPNNDQTPGMWTGDTIADWRGLDCLGCVPPDAGATAELTTGNSDIERAHMMNTQSTAAYWGGDTGGYDTWPVDEVAIRWLEYSTFTPLQEFFGAKSTGQGAKFPWLLGAGGATAAQTIALEYNQWRYRLLPFRYSNAQATYHTPSVRQPPNAAPVHYPVTWNGNFMILSGDGDSQILVQPVTSPGAKTASVALPPGQWILYWNGMAYTGGASAGEPDAGAALEGGAADASPDGTVAGGEDGGVTTPGGATTVSIPTVDQLPVFMKAGSIIPMGPVLHYVDEVPADPLTLDIYPAGKTNYTLYEDDGISNGYMGGAYSTTLFTSDDTSGHVAVTIGAQATKQFHYAGQLLARTYILKINGQAAAPAAVVQDGSPVPKSAGAADFASASTGWYYDPAPTTITGSTQAPAVWVKFRLDSSKATTVTLQ